MPDTVYVQNTSSRYKICPSTLLIIRNDPCCLISHKYDLKFERVRKEHYVLYKMNNYDQSYII